MKKFSDQIELIGPTWELDESGEKYKLPKLSLGWECIGWVLDNCVNEEGTGPFMFTPEQARLVLWFYAIDENGDFLYDEAQLQRLKGWGKDPFLAILALFQALGNCRFAGWEKDGSPIARPERDPLVGVAATTQEQTSTTMRLFSIYLSEDAKKKYKIEINTETVKSNGRICVQSVTSSPESLEGKIFHFIIKNETHLWYTRIAYLMSEVIGRNAAKVKDGAARIFSITNAFDPNQNSVAQQTRETYELQVLKNGESRILYDSIEAKPDAPINSPEEIGALVKQVRGDSSWSKVERIVSEFFDTRYPPDLNRRFWLNTVVSSEDSWVDIRDFDACTRATEEAKVRLPNRGQEIVLFFDGSKSSDSTVLVGCRVSDGYTFKIAAWHKPKKGSGPAGTLWLVPRNERDVMKFDFPGYPNPYRNIETVDQAVERAFKKYKVVAFFADPSHAKDEVDHRMYWDTAIESWHIKYSKQLKVWAGNKSGSKSESILWDMSSQDRIEEFAEYAEKVFEMIMRHELLIENDPEFRTHVRNAKIYRTRLGNMSIWKGRRNAGGVDDKIDLAVGMIGALMVRSRYLKQFGNAKKRSSYARFS